jgi:hypothetical protein
MMNTSKRILITTSSVVIRLGVLLVAATATLLLAGVANAATVGKYGSVLVYSAAPGEANSLMVVFDADYRSPFHRSWA